MKPDASDRRLRKSLVTPCLICILVYAGVLMGFFLLVGTAVGAKLDSAFPSMDTVLTNEDALKMDQYDALSGPEYRNCQIAIFDGDGKALYTSSSDIAESITASDLPIIEAYNDERSSYEVFEEVDGEGNVSYVIDLCSAAVEGEPSVIKASCVLDADLNIVSGDLFPGRSSLTEWEFSLINGEYGSKMSVMKYDYTTDDGESRTLVLAAPVVSETTYDAAVNEANKTWLLFIPLVILATTLAAFVLVRIVRSAIRPLDSAISARRGGGAVPSDPGLPMELQATYSNFSDLMSQLDATEQEKQRIIADVSHDLRTPLTVIRGYAQAIQDGKVPDGKLDEYLRAIADKSVVASELVDELLAYAKMEHPDFQPTMEEVDLCELLRRLAIDSMPEVEQADCSIDVNLPDVPIAIWLDEALFSRMIANLVSNAYHHNPVGTHILISCERVGDGHALISVADDGDGIPPELREHAFEPFVTDSAARTPGTGTGLGLSISQRCAEMHGGTIRLAEDVRVPYVTVIEVELPLRQA